MKDIKVSLSNEEKEKKQQYGREGYTNLLEDEKQKHVHMLSIEKKIYKMGKKPYYNYK